jgi:hypothetical protein
MQSFQINRGTAVCVLLMLGCVAMGPGCTKERSVRSDADTPPFDGCMNAIGGNDMDDGGPSADGHVCVMNGPGVHANDGSTADATVDGSDGSDDTSSVCTPAACEAVDGGADADPPPWGCPEACDPPCEGDTVCCDDGTCEHRWYQECDDGCDVELTVLAPSLMCSGAKAAVWVCNRGTTGTVAAGQPVRFEADGDVFCETETPEPLSPCECMRVECAERYDHSVEVRMTVNPDDPPSECGNPLGNTTTGTVVFCD